LGEKAAAAAPVEGKRPTATQTAAKPATPQPPPPTASRSLHASTAGSRTWHSQGCRIDWAGGTAEFTRTASAAYTLLIDAY